MRGRLVLLGRAPAKKNTKSRLHMLPSHTPQDQCFWMFFAFKRHALSSVFTLEYIISNLVTFGKRFHKKEQVITHFKSMPYTVL
jgi:hypothetical protein